MTRTCLTALLLVLAADAAHADLRFTTRIEIRNIATAEPLEPMTAMMAGMITRLLPSGETDTFINDSGARVEIRAATGSMLKAGTVMIGRDATMSVLDLDNRTYWTLTPPPLPLFTPGLEPDMQYTRTGEFAMVAGVRAERVTFRMSLPLPVAPPPRFPTSMVTEGELWVTDRFKPYGATMVRTLSALGTLLAGAPEGMIVRQITRSTQFGYEMEHTVSDLVEAPLPAGLFEMPEGFREVPTPLTVPQPAPVPAR
jgi:hypothetical protein